MPSAERREYPRADANMLVLFPGGRGRTLNISAGGLCLETDSVESLLDRETVPLEIQLEQPPPFMPAVVSGDGVVLRMHRFGSDGGGGEQTIRPERWQVAFKFQRPMEVGSLP